MHWRIRAVEADDIPILQEMLYEAATWRGGDAVPDVVLANPHIDRYLSAWGRPGDTALIAMDEDGLSIGAAWYRYFAEGEPGYGFVDETTPELSVAVVPAFRGRGVGTALMSALLEVAERDGVTALSLSVEQDNPAVKLYERVGFRTVSSDQDTFTMLVDVAR